MGNILLILSLQWSRWAYSWSESTRSSNRPWQEREVKEGESQTKT